MDNFSTRHLRDGRLISLQVLRAVAALMVAVGHLHGVDQRFFGGPVLPTSVQLGFAGVDLFFVLSGFVMVHVTRIGLGYAAVVPSFLFARAIRIYPLWWLVLCPIGAAWLIRPDWFATSSGMPNLLADFALWPHMRGPLLAVGWTLIHEVYFYLVFALLLLLPARYFAQGLAAWLLAVTIGNIWINANNLETPPIVALITHPLTLEFGFGAAIGLFAARGIRPLPILLGGLGLAWLIAIGALMGDAPAPLFENHWTRVLAIGPAWAFVVWGVVGLDVDRGLVPLPALKDLGDASYALYLLHVPLYAFARLLSPLCGPDVWDNIAACVLLLLTTVGAALFIHRYVERPLLAALTRLRLQLMPVGSALMHSPPPPLKMRLREVALTPSNDFSK